MMTRTRALVLFGGRSSEHQVSCLSARNVLAALDPDRYEVHAVGITRAGRWTAVDGVAEPGPDGLPEVDDQGPTVALVAGRAGPRLVRLASQDDQGITGEDLGGIDVCLPVLHGPYGEDGTIQGLLASMDVPYVGPDVAGSALGIDKHHMKRLFAARGLPQVTYRTVSQLAWDDDAAGEVSATIAAVGLPVYTKPARQGSSVGITRCDTREELAEGIAEALCHDRVALVERSVDGLRELECGVMGNALIEVTRPGETVHTGAFYDFDAKYLAPVELRCPADVPAEITQAAMGYAKEAYQAIGARGLSRVDLFYVEQTGELLVNEINTLPGLTDQSMYWAVWEAEGMTRPQIVDRLVDLALEQGGGGAARTP